MKKKIYFMIYDEQGHYITSDFTYDIEGTREIYYGYGYVIVEI